MYVAQFCYTIIHSVTSCYLSLPIGINLFHLLIIPNFADMRLVAGILFLYIVVLVAMPTYKAISEINTKEVCCKHCTSDKAENNDNLPPVKPQDTQSSCNPFEVCTSCIGFTLQSFPFLTTSYVALDGMVVVDYLEPSSDYISSVFHPPIPG